MNPKYQINDKVSFEVKRYGNMKIEGKVINIGNTYTDDGYSLSHEKYSESDRLYGFNYPIVTENERKWSVEEEEINRS